MIGRRLLAVFALCSLAASCGGSDAQCALDSDCPIYRRCEAQRCVPLGAIDAGSRRDSGSREGGMDASGDGGGDGSAPTRRRGDVNVFQAPIDLGGTDATTHAFAAVFGAGTRPGCADVTMGECFVRDCTVELPTADAGPPVDAGPGPTSPHAGTIAFTGGMLDLSLVPEASGAYMDRTGAGRLWTGGESVSIAASGGDVPSFTETFAAPGEVAWTSPSLAGPVTIDRTMGLPLSWTTVTGAPEDVFAAMVQTETVASGTRTVTLLCVFPASTGTATVGASALAALPLGSSGTISAGSVHLNNQSLGDWDVGIGAWSYATAPATAPLTVIDSTP